MLVKLLKSTGLPSRRILISTLLQLNLRNQTVRSIQAGKLFIACSKVPYSEKYREEELFIDPDVQPRPPGPKTAAEFADYETQKEKHWYSWGFDLTDKKNDNRVAHLTIGTTVCFFFVFYLYIIMHRPDVDNRHWVVREAFLEIDRRERLGLPYVDRDYVPAEKMILPPEEEIKDLAIYI